MDINEIRRRSADNVWHPYTNMMNFQDTGFPVIEKAQGSFLYEIGGKKLLDGISSWWCVNLGHSHPALVNAIKEQSEKLQHCILGGMSHLKAIELAEKINEIAPMEKSHVFFAGDGSCAVDAALKISMKYWKNLENRKRVKFISVAEGYHGDTFGAMGVGFIRDYHWDFEENMHKAFRAIPPHCAKCPFRKHPDSCDIECFKSMQNLIDVHYDETAAIILEPLCQGASGVRIYPEKYLHLLRAECDKHDILLIADEIAVGFGRTGEWFASAKAGIVPDIITIGKGLTGGYLPMSAAVVKDYIYDTFKYDPDWKSEFGEPPKSFMHGHTFCGNPITAALASTTIDVYKEEKIFEAIPEKSELLEKGFKKLSEILDNSFYRTLGMIASVEINKSCGDEECAKRITKEARDLGLFIRPLGNVIYLWPPLNCSNAELNEMINILHKAAEKSC